MLFPCCVVCQSNFSPAPEALPFFVGISSFFFYYVYSPHVGKLWQQAIPTSYLATTTPSSTGGYIALPRTSLVGMLLYSVVISKLTGTQPLHHQLTAHIRSTEYYIHRFSYGVHTILSLEPRTVRSSHPRCLICNTTPPPLAPTIQISIPIPAERHQESPGNLGGSLLQACTVAQGTSCSWVEEEKRSARQDLSGRADSRPSRASGGCEVICRLDHGGRCMRRACVSLFVRGENASLNGKNNSNRQRSDSKSPTSSASSSTAACCCPRL